MAQAISRDDGDRGTAGPTTAAAGAGVNGNVACSGAADFAAFRRDEAVGAAGLVAAASVAAIAVAAVAAAGPAAAGPVNDSGLPAAAPSDAEVPEIPAATASHSATLAKTGRPAEAASARVAGSVETIDRRRLLTTASRDRRRKFIRDVAIREP